MSNTQNTLEQLGLALYNINKIAKKYRDKKQELAARIYDEDNVIEYYHASSGEYRTKQGTARQHEALHTAEADSAVLYSYKDKCIKMARAKFNLEPLGYHEFADGNRDMYDIGGFLFHVNSCESDNSLGIIENQIESKKEGKKLSEKTARQIIDSIFAEELEAEAKKIEKEKKERMEIKEKELKIKKKEKEKQIKIFEKKVAPYLDCFSFGVDKPQVRFNFAYSAEFHCSGLGVKFTSGDSFEENLVNLVGKLKEKKKRIDESKKEKERIKNLNEKLIEKIKEERKASYMMRLYNRLASPSDGLLRESNLKLVEKAMKLEKEKVLTVLSEVGTGYGSEERLAQKINLFF